MAGSASSHGGGSGTQGVLEIPPTMEGVLRPHQISALQFVWRRLVLDGALRTAARTFSSTIEQRARLFQEVFGAILAHSMGLGKTLTSLTFVLLLQAQVTLMALKRERLRHQQQQQQGSAGGGPASSLRGGVCPALRVLVLCPRSCVLHWQSSIAEWVQPRYAGVVQLQVHVPSALGVSASSTRGSGIHNSSSSSSSGGRSLDDVLVRYYQQGGLLVLGYEEYQRFLHYAQAQGRSSPSTTWPRVWSLMDRIRLPLPLTQEVRLLDVLETADLVILDEAHRLRRSTSNLVTALAHHLRNVQLRIALTGTPLQNHLEEYNTMQSVATGRELDTQLFHKHFIAPIEHGQCVDSTYAQFVEMQRCVASLRNYFADSAHHCGPEVLAATLPPRREFIFFFRLSAAQEAAYKGMLKRIYKQVRAAEKGDSVLQLHHLASHICLHPVLAEAEAEGSSTNNNTATPATTPCVAASKSVVKQDARDDDSDSDVDDEAVSADVPAAALGTAPLADSPKLSFALHLTLYVVKELGEKVIIFSQYLSHLKLMAELLAQHGITAPALTGSTSDMERHRCIDDLQTKEACRVLLCSVRAGGVGIKLTAANHCILLDVSWNPSDDTQATYRLYRYGQMRPVNIYRLATAGTSEHIVFAYALQKSWLQKKIADVRDPQRQQRHKTRSYFRYPCAIPLPESAPTDALISEAEETPSSSSSVQRDVLAAQQQRADALAVCAAQCPTASAVLSANAAVEGAHLVSVIPQSTLLRHHDDDVIRERARQFEEAALKKRASEPMPLQLSYRAVAEVQREDQSLLEVCETELVDAARQAAHLLITHVLRVQEEQRDVSQGRHSDTISEVRTLDAALCRLLFPLVAPRLERRPRPRALAELFLWYHQCGVAKLVTSSLQGGAHLKLRTFLSSRIPAVDRHRPRDAPLPTRSPLEDALLFRPMSLLRAMSPVEATYVTTELGCDRPLVGHCMVRGLQQLWYGEGAAALSGTSLQSLSLLLGARAADEDDRDSDSDGGEAAVKGEGDAVALAVVLQSVLRVLEACLEEQWPPLDGLALPPQHLQLDREEMKMERAYTAATRAHAVGLLSLGEAAEMLRLPRFRQGHHTYGCVRCQHLLLHRMDATHLECPRCHYNAEFEIRADVRMQQQTSLYQLSVVANLLDAFSIAKSFATSFSPANCADVSAVLREVRTSQAALEFVRQAMREGVRVVLSEFPPVLVRLMGLQFGTGGDVEALARLLRANGRYAAHTNMREHLRQRITQAYADLVHPSSLAQLAAMPLLFVITALHYLARHEGITFAHELLLDEHQTPHRKLLRFASDALVKVLYVERLLRHCKEKPQLIVRADPVKNSGADAGAEEDDDVVSLGSLLRAASSSSSDGPPHHRPAPTRGGSPSSSSTFSFPSSSRSSSSGSSTSGGGNEGGVVSRKGKQTIMRPAAAAAAAAAAATSAAPAMGAVQPRAVYDVTSVDSCDTSDKETGSPVLSRSSSFASVYSDDRSSFQDHTSSEEDDELEGERARGGGLDAAGTWLEALVETRAPTAAELESEAVLQQRSAQYWIAFCEVYGTHSAETLTVYIEDDTDGMRALPPPPLPLWVSQVAHTTLVGMRTVDVLDLFVKKLVELSQQVRLIS